MNERMLELAKEAEWLANRGDDVDVVAMMEKFGELIVQECADIAKHHVMNISTYSDADFVEKQIREHFGVEA